MKKTFLVTVETTAKNISARAIANAVQEGLEESSRYWRTRLLSVSVRAIKKEET